MKALDAHIKDLEAERNSRFEECRELMQKAADEDRSLDAEENDKVGELKAEIKQLDADIQNYREMFELEKASATPVQEKREPVEKAVNRAPTIIKQRNEEEAFQGQNYTRQVIAKALAYQGHGNPIEIAEKRWGRKNPHLIDVMKADVAGGGSGSSEWGSELVSQDTWMGDFQEFLYSTTVYNQLPLREVPANITIKGQDGAATGYWTGESKAIAASKADFNDVTLTPLKVGAIAVVSNELLRDSSPSAEMLVRDSLVEAVSQRIDTTFISNTAASAGVSPAGILNNIAATTSSGTDGDAVANDVKELMYRFITAKNSGGIQFVMNPNLALALSLLRNALDQYEFPNVTENGGTLFGRPVVTGHNVNANYFIALKPSDIYRIGMGPVEVSMSQQATIEMDDSAAGDTDTPTAPTGKFVGMFQTESTAIKVVQSMNFARRRESAVAWISDADYGGAIST